MKKIILPLNYSGSMFLCFMCLFVANHVVAVPKIGCDTPKYDFGTVIGQEKITHEFIITNRGDDPLVISKIKNCCGVESKVVPETIPPGSNAVCTAVFTTKNRYGSQDKQILLITNDKKHPYFDLRLNGTLLKPIEFSPRWIRLGNLTAGSAIHQTITATNMLEQAVTLDSVDSTIQGIVAEVVGGTGDLARSWTIELHAVDSLPVGKLNGQVQLNFSSGTVNIPVIGTVKPILQATPNKIQLSSNFSGTIERLIMLRSDDGRPFDILSAKLENLDGNVETKKMADGKWKVVLKIRPASIKSHSSIVINTSITSRKTITIPILSN